ESRRLLRRFCGKVSGLLEVALPLAQRAEGCCPLARPQEREMRLRSKWCSVRGIRVEFVGVDEVSRDDLGNLVLAQTCREVLGGREMLRSALPLGERLVGDVAKQVLQKRE